MSHFTYEMSKQIAGHDFPFYALIMAAMRKADTENLRLLVNAFPDTWNELQARYLALGGYLPNETPPPPSPGRRHSDCMPGEPCLVGDADCPYATHTVWRNAIPPEGV